MKSSILYWRARDRLLVSRLRRVWASRVWLLKLFDWLAGAASLGTEARANLREPTHLISSGNPSGRHFLIWTLRCRSANRYVYWKARSRTAFPNVLMRFPSLDLCLILSSRTMTSPGLLTPRT